MFLVDLETFKKIFSNIFEIPYDSLILADLENFINYDTNLFVYSDFISILKEKIYEETIDTQEIYLIDAQSLILNIFSEESEKIELKKDFFKFFEKESISDYKM